MLSWALQILGLSPRQQLAEIEAREPTLEERLQRILARLGGYGARDSKELDELISDLEIVLDILDKILTSLENIAGVERAKNLRRRLKNNQTRAVKAREKLREAS